MTKMSHTYPLPKKLEILQEISHEIKKKRFILDENKENFGMDVMSQLVKVKNTSQIKGYPFKAYKHNLTVSKGLKLALKVVPIETKYEKNEHPANVEFIVLKELTENIVKQNISPHIAFYIATQKVSNKCRALKALYLKRLEVEDKIRTHSHMLVSEFVEGGSLDTWVFNTYENDKSISNYQWKSIVFQLLYTIAVIQKHYKMMHNDFHYGNILVDDTVEAKGYLVYEINGKTYYLKNTGVIPKLWDFEFSMVFSDNLSGSYPNKFITGPYAYDRKTHKTLVNNDESNSDDDANVPYNYNEVYDAHYFLTSLLDLFISQELFDWILKKYPDEVIPSEQDSSSSSTSVSDQSYSISIDVESEESINSELDSSNSDDSITNSTNSTESTSSESSDGLSNEFIKNGRLRNGVEEKLDLPTPLKLIEDVIFNEFTIVPEDFNPKEAMYFKAW
jgi:hypothetical protein